LSIVDIPLFSNICSLTEEQHPECEPQTSYVRKASILGVIRNSNSKKNRQYNAQTKKGKEKERKKNKGRHI
jgi:hypothetical protein